MKTLKALVLLAAIGLTSGAFAQEFSGHCNGRGGNGNGGCNTEPTAQWCYVRDGRGEIYKAYNDNVGSTVWAQYHAINACRAESSVPRTCHPLGCHP